MTLMDAGLGVEVTKPPRRRPNLLFRRLRADRLFRIGGTIVALTILLAIIGPLISPYDPTSTTASFAEPPPAIWEWPSLAYATVVQGADTPHWFGTDQAGLDVFSRVICAPRTDLVVALSAAAISSILGTLLGLLAGFTTSFLSTLVMRASDLLQSFPVFITAMILVSLAGRNTTNLVITLGLVYTPIFLRLTRAEVVVQITRGYVEAARALGNTAAEGGDAPCAAELHRAIDDPAFHHCRLRHPIGGRVEFRRGWRASANAGMGPDDRTRRTADDHRRMVGIGLSRADRLPVDFWLRGGRPCAGAGL